MKVPEQSRAIGGFFPLAIEDVPQAAGSVWQEWAKDFSALSSFRTARAALGALIRAVGPRSVWLPAYLCREASDAAVLAAKAISASVRIYALEEHLDPNLDVLDRELCAGDLVLVVDYFGAPPSSKFCAWARQRRDVCWVEDRAQALQTSEPAWADWCVYSPRKLVGVPDGGLLFCRAGAPPKPGAHVPPDAAFASAQVLRFEDRGESDNQYWYGLYRDREDHLDEQPLPMSRLTEALLQRIEIAPLVTARQTNYRYLLDRLSHLSAWQRKAEDFAPFGFVIRVMDPALLAHQLAEERLFCARHWPETTADPEEFPFEHGLSRHSLTLPCDHRYSPDDLVRLADTIERIAPAPAPVWTNG